MKTFFIYHIPVVVYAAIILIVSSVPNLQTPEVRFLAFDKVAHFLEYALFAYLAFRSVCHVSPRITNNQAAVVTFCILLGFAVLDEYLQSLTPGRHPDALDYLSDVVGGSLVLALTWLRRRRKLKQETNRAAGPAQ